MQLDQSISATGDSGPTDEKIAKDMHALQDEAKERLTFHRVECERWGRIGQAATMALHALQAAAPVQQASVDEWAVEFDVADPQSVPQPARY